MKGLALKNLRGKPGRTAALTLLTALLSLTILCGTVMVTSLRTGLSSLESRLGADIMVVPAEAATKKSLEDMILQGNTGYFYMPRSSAERIMETEGIAQVSEQFFLASASSGCCSIPVQIVGIDPERDFTVSPWIKKSYGGTLAQGDILVGNDLNAFVGDTLTFYGMDCRVAGKLDKTGTSFDSSVFTGEDTIKALIRSSVDLGMNDFKVDPDGVVSCVLINVADGWSVDEVMNDINIHVRKVKAVRTGDMISQVSGSLTGLSDMIGALMAVLWLLGTAILVLAFIISLNGRRKEFAVLRVLGASRKKLAGEVMKEALATGLAGSILGSLLGLLIMLPMSGAVESALGLPYLTPAPGRTALIALCAAGVSALSGMIAAGIGAFRMSRIDTGLILRGES